MVQRKVLRASQQGDGVILEPEERTWSRKFLDLAGSAPDFPYPEEPPSAEAVLISMDEARTAETGDGKSRRIGNR